MFLHQLINPSLSSVVFLVVSCMIAVDPSDGISWLAQPDELTDVEQGRPFSLHWHYEMDYNGTFLSSEIEFFGDSKPYPTTIASRHVGENMYYKLQWNGFSFSVYGKNNVTLKVQSTAAVGQNITYCCEVVWRSTAGKQNDKRCSKVFLYAVPQIIHHTPQLFCKQGDSIKLQCIATGIPPPRVEWIHNDTHQRIVGSSSDILLNITGKRSGGLYCCDADYGFGRDTACTTVNVTEYEPVNTKLSLNYTNILDVNMIRIKCEAVASPPANRFMMTINDTEYNSSDGLYSIKVPAARKDKIYYIAVSCIPFNKYGQGPIKKLVFPVYVMTKHNSSTADKGLNGTTPPALKSEIIAAIICACIFVVGLVVVVAVCFWRRIKASKVKNMDENVYQNPIDALDLERGGQQLSRAIFTSNNDDYATVEECGVPTSLSQTNEHPAEKEPLCKRWVTSEL